MIANATFHRSPRAGKVNKTAIQKLNANEIKALGFGYAQDSYTTAFGGAGTQTNQDDFLRSMLDGVIYQALEISNLDELVGRTTAGRWEDA